MSWSGLLARQQAAVYAALGEDASWPGITGPVRVILRDEDALVGLGVEDRIFLRVRQSEVASPAKGQAIELGDGRRFVLTRTPLLDRRKSWRCEAKPA